MTISELSVRRPVFALMLISFLVVLGLFSFRDLGVDLFPELIPPPSISPSRCRARHLRKYRLRSFCLSKKPLTRLAAWTNSVHRLRKASQRSRARLFSKEISKAPPRTSVKRSRGR